MSSTTKSSVRKYEEYSTPREVIMPLLNSIEFRTDDIFLEPCRGGEVRSIYDRVPLPETQKHWCEIQEDKEYLTTQFNIPFDIIITNPPFSLTEDFMRKSLKELSHDGVMCYLQRVNFLGSLKRMDFWDEVGYPNKMSIVVPRPKFILNSSDSTEYAWFIYDRGNRINIPEGLSNLYSPRATKLESSHTSK